jgi:hypothetical protein
MVSGRWEIVNQSLVWSCNSHLAGVVIESANCYERARACPMVGASDRDGKERKHVRTDRLRRRKTTRVG